MRTLEIRGSRRIGVRASVRHSELCRLAQGSSPAISRSGVALLAAEVCEAEISSVLIDEVKEQIAQWEANLSGTQRDVLPSLGGSPSPRSAIPVAYLWYRYANGTWTRSRSRDPNQPNDGFAVCDDESPEQIELLCAAYARYSEEDRYMLRLMAHVAIAERRRT